jgi:hypothetical protein
MRGPALPPPPAQAKAFEDGLAALARQALQNDPEAAAQLKRCAAGARRGVGVG